MMPPMSKRPTPEWLRPRWEQKMKETAARVQEAVDQSRRQGRKITLDAIRDTIRSTCGVSISTNTIKRNDLAYQVYVAHRPRPRVSCLPDPGLRQVIQNAPAEERHGCVRKSHACGASARTSWLQESSRWRPPPGSRETSRTGCGKRSFA